LLKKCIIGCQDVHRCIKKQAYSRKVGSSMWSGVISMSTMHPSNVGSSAHIDQVCLVAWCNYLWIPWCSEISRGWVTLALYQIIL
jgi:hypothetical protein